MGAKENIFTVIAGSCVASGDCVQSPNFPSAYGTKEKCVIIAPPYPLIVEAFETEASISGDYDYYYDTLNVNGVNYGGVTGPAGVTPNAPILWYSDLRGVKKGWKICAQAVETEEGSASPAAGDSTGLIIALVVVGIIGVCCGIGGIIFFWLGRIPAAAESPNVSVTRVTPEEDNQGRGGITVQVDPADFDIEAAEEDNDVGGDNNTAAAKAKAAEEDNDVGFGNDTAAASVMSVVSANVEDKNARRGIF